MLSEGSEEEFVEIDPSGRYGRYAEVLGEGATKIVYKAFDMVDCREVAWNKAKADTHADGPADGGLALEREIILLQRLNHNGIIKLFDAWVDQTSGDTTFITELCSSALLAFLLKHKHVNDKAVKSWARQILEGLVYLHTQDPPIIHRDLKTENIFVKSSSTTDLKIGDFGCATILNDTHHMHTVVGTPEFMAPEMFQQDYNELVDVYSFGMCMLELLTRECPYSECTSVAQIYKHVTGGKKPKALLKVKDVQALQFINRCLLPARKRPSAKELLHDPFLQHKEVGTNSMQPSKSMPSLRSFVASIPGKLLFSDGNASKEAPTGGSKEEKINGSTEIYATGKPTDLASEDAVCLLNNASSNRTYLVVGTQEGENTLRLRIRIQESNRCSNIVFPFNVQSDTPQSVAEEMIRALNYPQSDMVIIADLISEELAVLAKVLEGDVAAPMCSKKLKGSVLKRQQIDNSLMCAGLSNNTNFVESNCLCEEMSTGSEKGPFEKTGTVREEGCCGISALVTGEKSKESMYDKSSADSISEANSDFPITSDDSQKSGSSFSCEFKCKELLPKMAALASDEKRDSSSAKQSGSSDGKTPSSAAHNKKDLPLMPKNSLSFKKLPKFSWRPPFEQGIQGLQLLYVNTRA